MGMFHARQQPALGCGPRLTPECTPYDHAPEFAFEKSLNNVRRAVKDMRSITPVAVDNENVIWRALQEINIGQRCISQQGVTSRTSEANARMVTLPYCPITLYGSITSSAVISFSYVRFAMLPPGPCGHPA